MSGCALTPSAESGLEELTGTQSTNGIYVVEYKVPQKKSEMQKFPLSEGVTVQQADDPGNATATQNETGLHFSQKAGLARA